MFGLNPYVLMAVAGLWLASIVGVGIKVNNLAVDRTDAKWMKVEFEREVAATQKFNEATQRYIDAEAKNNDQTRAWEKKSYDRDTYIKGMQLANGRLVAAAGGLLDRNGRAAGGREGNAGGAAAGAGGEAADAAAGCKLSAELEGFLLSEAARADAAAAYAQAGHDFAVVVEEWRKAHKPKVAP